MSTEEISNILLNANRPIDVFGDLSLEEVKKKYKLMVKKCHPDLFSNDKKDMASKLMILLNDYYERALKEFENGIYNITDEKEILETNEMLFDFEIRGKKYQIYKYLASDDVCDIYEGTCDEKVVLLKIAMDENDNELVENEYSVVKELDHYSIIKPLKKLKINDKVALIYEKPNALNIKDFKKTYGLINGSHVSWILERLLSVIGYLHSKKIVHGNIKEENVLIDPENHNVILIDYSLCISDADNPDSKYKIINDHFTPSYVTKDARVVPNTDIYAVGKIAVDLLGGDIDRVTLPISCDYRMRSFIRKLISGNEQDAWKLWDELRGIRTEVYGNERFKKLSKRK
ncbi:MAG: protein kinase family protein [Bacilli bacterium]|nr:protein kinase family protein [Bacilli bacterium]